MNNKKKNILKTVLCVPMGSLFDYQEPEDLTINCGDIIEVPFGKRQMAALVTGKGETSAVPQDKLKQATKVLAKGLFSDDMVRFMEKAADYNLISLGQVLKMAMPIGDVFRTIKRTKATKDIILEQPIFDKNIITLNDKQQEAADILSGKIGQGYSTTLLKGLTGSGKTEVYFEAIKQALAQEGGQVLVMLPEIMLTNQWLERFKRRFKACPACWHSALTPKSRRETWKGVADGRVKVLVGARSALFLPFSNLKLIIVDEEHDQSYKQEEGTIYHARDMAVLRANIQKIPVILSSATPSIETYANVKCGKYEIVRLPERYQGAKLPEIHLINMCTEEREKINGEKAWISPTLSAKVTAALDKGQQSLLFLNRRGYAPLMLCGKCGHRICCPNCSSWLVWHKKENRLICHYCNYNVITPQACPECQNPDTWVACGPGAERIYAEAKQRWEGANIALVTSDTLASPSAASCLIDDILSGKINILVGTQILTKGHHFPKLTVVGVIDADLSLAADDMRAAERTYQLLNQVAGRAGRESLEGEVFLQTYMPENEILQAIAARDEEAFFHSETEARKVLNMPPFGKTASIIVSGKKETEVLNIAKSIVRLAPPASYQVQVLGPAPASVVRLNKIYRFRILAKAPKNVALSLIIKEWLTKLVIPYNIKVTVDIEPYSNM